MRPLSSILLFFGVVLALCREGTAQTNIGIAAMGAGQSALFWPNPTDLDPTNVVFVQSVTNLASTNWTTMTDGTPMSALAVSNGAGSRFFRAIYTSAPPDMALVPSGWFEMGPFLVSAWDPQFSIVPGPQTNIFVSAFYMDRNLVSYSLWRSVHAYATNQGYAFDNPGSDPGTVLTLPGTNFPVYQINWYDAVKWCNARSQQAGLTPVYYNDAAFSQLFVTGQTTNVYARWSANGYRLPTEAEWEKAARGGVHGRRFPWGNLISKYHANYFSAQDHVEYDLGPYSLELSGGQPSQIGSYDVNGYGLYDMAGNLYQWCWDWFGADYGVPTPVNPTGPASGVGRTLRGGSGQSPAAHLRCDYRVAYLAIHAYGFHTGFRCVRRP